jgi:hypothetical protein
MVSQILTTLWLPITLLTVWFIYNSYDVFAFLKRQKERDIKFKLAKIERYHSLLKESLITYKEFEKKTK